MVRSGFHAHLDSAWTPSPGSALVFQPRQHILSGAITCRDLPNLQRLATPSMDGFFAFFRTCRLATLSLLCLVLVLAYADSKMLGLFVYRLMDA